MYSVNNNLNIYALDYYKYTGNKSISGDYSDNTKANLRETITTWRFDEEGNIVYYTLDKKTGEIISKTKYENPNKVSKNLGNNVHI